MARRKRINPTDEELAIGMWVYLYLKIDAFDVDKDEAESVIRWKFNYLEEHGILPEHWYNACLLCQRYINEGGTCNCPLSEGGLDCGYESTYNKVVAYYINEHNKKKALEACKKIIGIMIKEADNGIYEE